jgi:ABC-type Fe3+-hydroxamate transport system substrate-binding protein
VSIFTDHLGNKVDIPTTPRRIVSIVPSQTELLFDLGLDNEVIGITKYCIHPKEKVSRFKNTHSIVGGTKKLNIDLIKKLNPDLIIGNKEENEKSQIEELQKVFPVWMSNIQTLEEAYDMIQKIGMITEKKEKAFELTKKISHNFSNLKKTDQPKQTLYLIWRKPYIAVGADTFIHHMIKRCGLNNALNKNRYPQISMDEIQTIHPEYIFLSSEPYPFKEKHIAELRSICPSSKIVLVDGELFSWYGSRLLYSPGYFNTLLPSLN